ncbi:MAG: CehA/McbA family metallohydrolase [Candidatus Neomarinimicrobiota bacterium]
MSFPIQTVVSELPLAACLASLFVPVLYAELHYRFPYFPFSRYYLKEPEIIADTPHRLDPGAELPILILIKDSHRFPIHLQSVEVDIRDERGKRKQIFLKKNLGISQRWWHEIIQVNVQGMAGICMTEVTFRYAISGRERTCVNDNSPASKIPFVTRLSSSLLPGASDGWVWGDLHCHSWMTDDFVEFGAPIDAIQKAAAASGLGFVAITDHSYDLDDKPGSWTEHDPELTKWKQLLTEVKNLNRKGVPVLIPGEEVSVGSNRKKNVHLLVLNHPELIPGSGDGAERWLRTRSELSIRGATDRLKDDSLAIAAHPKWRSSRLESLLLKRGQWESGDLRLEGIAGMQILNGDFNREFEDGLVEWSRLLLAGEKRFIYAGNDAHGNFNRFLQVKRPMLSLWQHHSKVLGKCRTGLHLPEEPSIASIISTLRRGKCVVSNGPLALLKVSNLSSSVTLGGSINGNNMEISVSSRSSREYGRLKWMEVKFGDFDRREEKTICAEAFREEVQSAESSTQFSARNLRGYVRTELRSVNSEGEEFVCYTNPVWINN